MKKTLRVLALVFLGLILFLFAFYLIKNEPLPEGQTGPEADELANKMLEALNYEAWEATPEISWTFKGMNHYRWSKADNMVEVTLGDDPTIYLNTKSSSIAVRSETVKESELEGLKNEAINNFNNDSFWLCAPYKIFDPGTERSIVTLKDGREGLKVTYTSGGSTPGDSYVWILDENYIPTAVKMWVSIIPIGGLEFTWENYKTLETGAMIAQDHIGLGGVNIDVTHIETSLDYYNGIYDEIYDQEFHPLGVDSVVLENVIFDEDYISHANNAINWIEKEKKERRKEVSHLSEIDFSRFKIDSASQHILNIFPERKTFTINEPSRFERDMTMNYELSNPIILKQDLLVVFINTRYSSDDKINGKGGGSGFSFFQRRNEKWVQTYFTNYLEL